MQHLDDGQLQEWVDRSRSGLMPDERDRIERHLAECEVCTDRLADLTEVGNQAASLLAVGSPFGDVPDFAHVSGRAATLASGVRRRRLMQGGAWAASVAIALGIGWGANDLMRQGPDATAGAPTASADPTSAAETTSSAEGIVSAERMASAEPAAGAEPAASAGPAAPLERTASAAPVPTDAATNPSEAEVVASEAPSPTTVSGAGLLPPTPVVVAEASPSSRDARPADDLPEARAIREPHVVRGRVTDEVGSPLADVQVFIGGTDVGVLTNAQGAFRLQLGESTAIADRTLTLTAQRIGYGSVTRDVTGGPGDTATFDLRMSAQSLSLDEIVVTGSAPPAARREERSVSESAFDNMDPVIVGAAEWSPRSRAVAEGLAGFAIMAVADRAVRKYSVEPFGGVWVSRVEQTLEDGTTVALLQSRRPIAVGQGVLEEGQAMASTTRGGMSLVIVGALRGQALEAVLDRVR